MKCPECKSKNIVKNNAVANSSICYSCGYASYTSAFAEHGDVYEVKDVPHKLEPLVLDQGGKYRKQMHSKTVDVYDILRVFNVTNPATQHAIKKLLVTGGRGGGKSVLTDLKEAHWQIERAIQLEENYQ